MDNTEKESKLTIIDRMLRSNGNIVIVNVWETNPFTELAAVAKRRLKLDLGEGLESWPQGNLVHIVKYFIAPQVGVYNPKRLNEILGILPRDEISHLQPEWMNKFDGGEYSPRKFMRMGQLGFNEKIADAKRVSELYIKSCDDIFLNSKEEEPVRKEEESKEYYRDIFVTLFPDREVASDIFYKVVGWESSSFYFIKLKDLDKYVPEIKKPKRKDWFGRKKIRRIGDLLEL